MAQVAVELETLAAKLFANIHATNLPAKDSKILKFSKISSVYFYLIRGAQNDNYYPQGVAFAKSQQFIKTTG